ncbi:hypothetical protein ElyMa_004699000 [Elysia marginata]|uniref:Centromere protein O n=1 Tax=Elysia marginata TaxID=1093978 RepID=A0AAV4I6U8_9GAST|nr:hypothetical protein ElyMa_004699000 [Elysia marginata]
MNAYTALQELRKTRDIRHQHATLCDAVKEQLETIVALQEERDVLQEKLDSLTSGQTMEELDRYDDPELTERTRVLRELREKLAAYRLIGPCGLSVSDVEPSSLTVTFTPMWRSLAEDFYVSLVAKEDGIQVSATNIPYFFNLPSLVASMKADVAEVLNVISLKLVAYIQRKAEVQLAMRTHGDVITSSSFTEPITSVDLQLQSLDTATEIMKQIDVYVTYSNVDDVHPERVKLSPKNIPIPVEVEEELCHLMLTNPLSSALTRVVQYLTSTGALVEPQLSDEEESAND